MYGFFCSCGVAMVQPPCYLVEDKTKAYPDCCPQPVCPETSDETKMSEDELFGISEENNISASNETEDSFPSSDSRNVAMHFSLGKQPLRNFEERNDLEEDKQSEESLEIIQPRLIPPNFEYATFDDIDSNHERFNEVDGDGDYQLV